MLDAYQSAWLPAVLLSPTRQASLCEALVAASAKWSVTLHTNKGLAGGSPVAIERTLETATNPVATHAFALLICAAEGPPAWPGIPGHEPDITEARRHAFLVSEAMLPIRRLVPDAGAYVSEANFFEQDWPRAYWGDNYPRLLGTRRSYDPTGFFSGHHTVGSG